MATYDHGRLAENYVYNESVRAKRYYLFTPPVPNSSGRKVEDAILAKVEELNAERSKATAEDAADGTAEE